MRGFRKGDVVARKSYNEDVLFIIDRIINKNNKVAILKGITIRIEADAPIEDLVYAEKDRIKEEYEKFNLIMNRNSNNRYLNMIKTGKILHLDGDNHLSNQKKHTNINTSKQVIFSHNKNNVSKIKIHYFVINFKGKPRDMPVVAESL